MEQFAKDCIEVTSRETFRGRLNEMLMGLMQEIVKPLIGEKAGNSTEEPFQIELLSFQRHLTKIKGGSPSCSLILISSNPK